MELTYNDLINIQDYVPGLTNFLARNTASSYQEFVDIIYMDLDAITSRMEENPELYSKDSEDRLTIDIKNQLCGMGYDASHDTKIGGHVDLVVKQNTKNWKWIGEAKKYNSTSYLFKGFQQLSTRYSIGSYNNNQGALLIYIYRPTVKSQMLSWQEYLTESHYSDDVTVKGCDINPFSFYSVHTHQRTELPFTVRHIPFSFIFDPQDNKPKAKRGNRSKNSTEDE